MVDLRRLSVLSVAPSIASSGGINVVKEVVFKELVVTEVVVTEVVVTEVVVKGVVVKGVVVKEVVVVGKQLPKPASSVTCHSKAGNSGLISLFKFFFYYE